MKSYWTCLLFIGIFLPLIAGAFVSTSTSFFVRQSLSRTVSSSSYPYSTSTSFQVFPSAGGIGLGTSTSANFSLRSGFLNGFKTRTKPLYTQTHYHWRNDNGSETTATSKTSGTQDTAITNVTKSTIVRARFGISNEGGTYYSYSPQQFRIEYGLLSTTCGAIASWTQVGAGGAVWLMSDSANLTNANNTTNISTSVGGVSDTNATFLSTNGGIRDTASDTGSLTLSSDSFVELEYSISADTTATDGATYCFRITDVGTATLFRYDNYPQATLTAGSLIFTTDSGTASLPALTPGTLVATSTILSITTSNSTGFSVSLVRASTTATMGLISDEAVIIPDKTDWMAPGATTTVGGTSASTTQSQTLQFRVRQSGTDAANYASVWWGSADTTAQALFGGIPSTTQTIINRSVEASGGTTAYVLYNLDVPLSQRNGAYSGSVTYTAVANP